MSEDGIEYGDGFMAKPLKFKVGDMVEMTNREGVQVISAVRPSDAPHRSHKYSVNGSAMEYYEQVFTMAETPIILDPSLKSEDLP